LAALLLALLAASPCEAEQAATAKWIETLSSQAETPTLPLELDLVAHDGSELDRGGLPILLDAKNAWPRKDPDGARRDRAEVEAALLSCKQPRCPPLVAIEKTVPWERVVDAVDAFVAQTAEEQPSMMFVFLDPAPAEHPAKTPRDDQIMKGRWAKDGLSAGLTLCMQAHDLLSACPAMEAAFASACDAKRAGDRRNAVRRLAGVLPSCDCKLSLPVLKAVLWGQFAPPRQHLRGVELKLSRGGTPVRLPARLPWSEAVPKLLEAKGSLKLEVAR
jgi:hypothetical protein